ncbi:MAG: hypothetical protein D6765_07440 [Bacteroidetes bacterium]|nr:MAG: hypothetical protein D6765_07440 [Bacteroidota bacterium]
MDTLSPDAEAFGNTLDCANTVVQIQGNSTTPGVTFSWSGPAGYTSTEQNPSDIAVAGLYTLTVTAPNGCQSSAQAVVVADFAAPDAQASGGTLTCQSGSVTLTGTSSTPGVTYSWSGPGGFTSNEQNPKVSEAGTYTLTVTAPNGCTQTATAVVDLDANVPQVAVGNGIISCAEPQDTLIAATNAPNPTFSWTGPGGFSSNQQNPVVTLPGSYTVVVTAANGCTAQATAEVVDNTAPPQIMASGGTITCTNPTVTLSASSTTPGVTYQWTTPAGTVLQEQNPEVSEAGDYHLLVTAPNGCTAEETVSVLLDADVPQVSASVSGQLTCLVQEVELSGSSSHPDVEYFWEGPSFQAFAQNVTVSVPGSYLLTVSAPNGCSASASVLVVQDTEAPEVSASVSGPITCAEPVVTLEGSSSTPGATFSWSFEGSVLSTEAVVSVIQAGTYELLVTGPNGCTAQTSVLVEQDPTVPVAEAQGGVLTCAQPSLQLVGSANLPDVSFSWTGPGGFSSDLPNPTVDLPGTYTLTVTDAQGCSATATALVEEDKVAPLATIAPPDQLTCIVESVTLDASGSDSGPGFALDWSTADGNFLSGTSGLQPVVDAPGTYQLTVTNQSNGCSSTATVAVELSDAVPNDADILAQPPTCFGERDGRIVIEEVFGGTPPYTYSLNFAPFTTNPQFLGLGGGKYELTIQDAQGCEWNTLIELQEPPELEVFLEAKGLTDNTLQLGDEVQLEALPTVFPSQLQQVIWLPEGLVPDCPLCLQPLVQPTHTTRIQVIVEDLNGCTAQDELLLVVDRSRPVFIPNVFSPDGDGINDRFYVFGGRSVVRIHALRIFDRWGEPVFEKLDMLPNDPGEGWDGTYRGQELDQGVYTWFAEIEFLDGEVELFKGDVLLIR